MRRLLAGILCALAAGLTAAVAAPLEEAACAGLKSERETLVGKGVPGDMARGPEWGKSNLSPERLQEIERMIEVDEQLTFRCGQLKVAHPAGKVPAKKKGVTASGEAQESAAPAASGSTDPQAQPQAEPQAEPPKTAAKKKKGSAKTAKNKASDAYAPPPASADPAPDASPPKPSP
jgi:hypothetical protein